MLKVTGSISTKTGVAPTRAIAPAVAKKVNGVVMTSSPTPIPSTMREMSRASEPEETPHAPAALLYAATSDSKFATFAPRMNIWESQSSSISFMISGFMAANCPFRSRRGTCMIIFLSVKF